MFLIVRDGEILRGSLPVVERPWEHHSDPDRDQDDTGDDDETQHN